MRAHGAAYEGSNVDEAAVSQYECYTGSWPGCRSIVSSPESTGRRLFWPETRHLLRQHSCHVTNKVPFVMLYLCKGWHFFSHFEWPCCNNNMVLNRALLLQSVVNFGLGGKRPATSVHILVGQLLALKKGCFCFMVSHVSWYELPAWTGFCPYPFHILATVLALFCYRVLIIYNVKFVTSCQLVCNNNIVPSVIWQGVRQNRDRK